MTRIAALGIGGTNLHAAVADADASLHASIPVRPTEQRDLVSQVLDTIDALETNADGELDAVSMACKGLVDRQQGRITGMNTPDGEMLADIDLGAAIDAEFGLPWCLENDCAAATLAEYEFGAGNQYNSLVHITMGTGIGAGVIDHGHLIRGATNQAAEVGAIQVGPADGRTQFGIHGAWEAYCSGPGIAGYVTDQLATEERETPLQDVAEVSPQMVFECAAEGDVVARDYLDQLAQFNARGLAAVAKLFDPGVITLGGGVALNNFDVIIDGVESYIDEYLFDDAPEFAPTAFGEDIGIYAAIAAYNYHRSAATETSPIRV